MRSAALLASAAFLLPGCAAARRGAEDAAVVATLPVHIVTTPAGFLSDAWKEEGPSSAIRAPLMLPLFLAGDLLFTGVSAVDLALTPAYAPFPVKPLGLYDLSPFPPMLDRAVGKSAGTATVESLRVLAPVAGFFLLFTGRAGWSGPVEPWQPPPGRP